MKEFFRLHGIPNVVISDKYVKFTSSFWKDIFTRLGTKVQFNIRYHPQMDGKTERINQVMEDMIMMYVLQ